MRYFIPQEPITYRFHKDGRRTVELLLGEDLGKGNANVYRIELRVSPKLINKFMHLFRMHITRQNEDGKKKISHGQAWLITSKKRIATMRSYQTTELT